MGIRLFDSKGGLQSIFEEFEENEDAQDEEDGDTAVVTSQLRHFVIQVCPLDLSNLTLFSYGIGIPCKPSPLGPRAKCWKGRRQSSRA